jgi:flavin reductase (DIM6/NTAB) family NADH-FMN oxidoreductase RutF
VVTSFSEAVDVPLYVVTAAAGEETSGCLAGFVTQASIIPTRYLVCISKLNHTFGVAARSQALAVHLLGADQHVMAAHFGEMTGDATDKFTSVQWSTGATGSPLIADCAAFVEGRILRRMSGGDHEAFLIRVDREGDGPRSGQFTTRQAADIAAGHPAE